MAIIAAGRHAKKKGSSRMREFGYKKVEVWLDETEASLVVAAAAKTGTPLATWVREAAVVLANKSQEKRPLKGATTAKAALRSAAETKGSAGL